MLRNCITGSYYGNILGNYITELHDSIILQNDIMELSWNHLHEKDLGDAQDVPRAP